MKRGKFLKQKNVTEKEFCDNCGVLIYKELNTYIKKHREIFIVTHIGKKKLCSKCEKSLNLEAFKNISKSLNIKIEESNEEE